MSTAAVPRDTAPAVAAAVCRTPVGPLLVRRHPGGTITAEWVGPDDPAAGRAAEEPILEGDLVDRLGRYFAGEAISFDDVPTPPGPPFFRRCWNACRAIPAGETISYGELARRAGGDGRAARAAGQAMRRNPLPVIVPCHRVVAGDGRLHGYAGSTDPDAQPLDRKRWLLGLESGAFAGG